MSSTIARRQMQNTLSVKRAPAASGGTVGAAETLYTGVPCGELDPLDAKIAAETQQRLGLKSSCVLKRVFAETENNIVNGHILVIGGTDYPVRSVERWPGRTGAPTTLEITVEVLR